MGAHEWVILFKGEKSHRLVLPSFGRVLQWIAGNGAKCSSIFIVRREKESADG